MRAGRVDLERAGPAHLNDLVEAIRASLEELQPWMAWALDWDPAETRRYILGRSDNDHLFAVLLDGAAIGVANVLVSKPMLGWGEIGYWLSSEHAGQGYMTEAVDAIVSWSFDDLGLHRVELRAGVDNPASNRVAEKLGFRNCGLVRESATGADGFYDCNLWELVVGDPRPTL